MNTIAHTPEPPYYAVIFTSLRTTHDKGYDAMAEKIYQLATLQPGYLGFESARTDIGISISYWKDPESILNWKKNSEHLVAQQLGIEVWYASYKIRICKVERDYGRVNATC